MNANKTHEACGNGVPAAYRWGNEKEGQPLTSALLAQCGVNRAALSRNSPKWQAARRGRRKFGHCYLYRWHSVKEILAAAERAS